MEYYRVVGKGLYRSLGLYPKRIRDQFRPGRIICADAKPYLGAGLIFKYEGKNIMARHGELYRLSPLELLSTEAE